MSTAKPFAFSAAMLAQHLAIVGRTGSGKTYTAKGAVEGLLAMNRRVCVLDPTGVWYGLRSSADGKHDGWPVAVFGGSHADVPIGPGSGQALAQIIAEKNLPSIIDLSDMLIGQRHGFVTDFAEALYRLNRAPLHLVIDEADEFCPQNPMPETKRMLHHIDRIVRRGRVRGFRVMLITQRPAVLHKNVLTQANTLVAMRLTSPQDRAALKAWVDGQADAEQGKAVMDSLAKLKTGEGWVWAPEEDILRRVTFPHITTFDSGRAPDDDDTIEEPTKLAAVDLAGIAESLAPPEKPELGRRLIPPAPGPTQDEIRALIAKAVIAAGEALDQPLAAALESVDSVRAAADLAHRAVLDLRDQHIGRIAKAGAAAGYADGGQVTVLNEGSIVLDVAPGVAGMFPKHRPELDVAVGKAARKLAHNGDREMRGISAPMQRILNAIAQLNAFGVEQPAKQMIAAHAGASPRSSSFSNNLGALRTKGLIDYPAGGLVALTASGREQAETPDRAPTIDEIHASWLAVVSNPQGAIVRALIESWPRALAKTDLAQRVGASPASSSYSNNLGSLRTLGLVAYPVPGHVGATELLFPARLV